MAEIRPIHAAVTIDPPEPCPACAVPMLAVDIDGTVTAALRPHQPDTDATATVRLTARTLTARPCGHLLETPADDATEGTP